MSSTSTQVPARLYFMLARNAPSGVIFRRGPSKWVQLIRWHTDTDIFEEGQWFNGRIYERRCDLSPDGTKLVYFAQKSTARQRNSDVTYAWTAVSKPPYLAAIALWPNGHCWNGGGLFESDSLLWLNHPTEAVAHPDHPAPRHLQVRSTIYARGEDATVLDQRLDRDGWRLVKQWRGEMVRGGVHRVFHDRLDEVRPSDLDWLTPLHQGIRGMGYVTFGPEVREKMSQDGKASLIMIWTLIGFDDAVRFTVRDNITGERISVEGAEWADWDRSGRLVYVSDGRVFAASVGDGGLAVTQLADLNGNRFRNMPAPEWATEW